jgi:hypothetical protein
VTTGKITFDMAPATPVMDPRETIVLSEEAKKRAEKK